MIYLQTVFGLLLLLAGAEALVRGSAAIALRLGVSTLIIGMTVVAFGTSAPELVVTVQAALAGAPGIAVGNIVGSNIANVLLIVGFTGLCVTIPRQDRPMLFDSAVLVTASGVFALFVWLGAIDRWAGAVLFAAFLLFLGTSTWREYAGQRADGSDLRSQEAAELAQLPGSAWLPWISAIAGLGCLILGAEFLVSGASAVARLFGVSDAVIGLTMVALGTSLPELAASVVAGVRGHPDIAIGNVLGSNIFNILLVGGAASMISPLPVDPQIAVFDIWVMLAATILFLPCLLGGRINRLSGFALLALYGAFLAVQFVGVDALAI